MELSQRRALLQRFQIKNALQRLPCKIPSILERNFFDSVAPVVNTYLAGQNSEARLLTQNGEFLLSSLPHEIKEDFDSAVLTTEVFKRFLDSLLIRCRLALSASCPWLPDAPIAFSKWEVAMTGAAGYFALFPQYPPQISHARGAFHVFHVSRLAFWAVQLRERLHDGV